MACCSKSSGDKEVKSCPVCGEAVPPSLGYKPRKYCSAVCRGARQRKHRPAVAACEFCGCSARQRCKGPPKRFCSKLCQSRARSAKKPKKPRVKKSYPKVPCEQCGDVFEVVNSGQKLCSAKCRNSYTAARNIRNSTTYTCLCCLKPFRKKGTGRNSGKYCSRECAFDARRLRLPCVSVNRRKGTSISGQLAVWFHSWGSDADEPKNVGCRRGGHKHRCIVYGCHYEHVNERMIYERDGWACQCCGKPLKRSPAVAGRWRPTPDYPTIDHIIPLSFGPSGPGHCPSNIRAACWGCNSMKSNKHPDSFVSQYTTSLD